MDEINEQHQRLVTALVKPGSDIAPNIDAYNAHVLHMVVGLLGECGELLDAIKRPIIYGSPWDFKNIEEELGDIEFYLEGLRQGLSINRDVTLKSNIEKLHKRYTKMRYSDEEANARKDKA